MLLPAPRDRHSRATLGELAELGMVPRKSVVIPHGPYEVSGKQDSSPFSRHHARSSATALFGVIEPYKGVDNLIAAFTELPSNLDAQLSIIGECRDPALRRSLTDLAGLSRRPIVLRFEHIAEAEISDLMQNADAVVLPHRRSSTSGSAVLALSHGRPMIVPDLPGLAELPHEAVIRYDRTVQGLTAALSEIILAEVCVLAKMSDAAYEYCASISWGSIARKTLDELSQIV